MGKIVTIEYVDDLDGVPVSANSVDTVDFSYRGRDYSVVLTKKNGAQFDRDIARYIDAADKAQTRDARAARKTGRTEPRRAAKPKAAPASKAATRKKAQPKVSGEERNRAIREWAAKNGRTVSARGRIAKATIEAYDAAH